MWFKKLMHCAQYRFMKNVYLYIIVVYITEMLLAIFFCLSFEVYIRKIKKS